MGQQEEREYVLCERCGTDVAHIGLIAPFDREGNPHFHWDEWNITQE